MKRMLWGITVSMGVALFGLSLVPTSANATVRDYFKCTLADGATQEAVEKVASDFLALARKEGFGDYSIEFLSPMYAGDISPGTFFWAGLAPNGERMGAINDFWGESEANADIRKSFRALATCESSSLHIVTPIE